MSLPAVGLLQERNYSQPGAQNPYTFNPDGPPVQGFFTRVNDNSGMQYRNGVSFRPGTATSQNGSGSAQLQSWPEAQRQRMNTIGETAISSGSTVVQGVFKKIDTYYIDEESKETYYFDRQLDDNIYSLYNHLYRVIMNANGELLKKYPLDKNDYMPDLAKEFRQPEQLSATEEDGDMFYPEEHVGPGIKEETGAKIGKLTTDLTAQIRLLPMSQGSNKDGQFNEYKYTANQIWVSSVELGDLDRPETQFDNQESHTVSWTLVRNGIMALKDQTLQDFVLYLKQAFDELAVFTHELEGKILSEMATGNNLLQSMAEHKLPLAVWQTLTSRLLIQYLQVYQLSSAATYKRGPAKGHGESHARKRLEDDNREAEQHKKCSRSNAKIALDIAKLLDVQFRVDSLGVQEYAFAIKHWIEMLDSYLPSLMAYCKDDILKPVLEKQLAVSFKRELGLDDDDNVIVMELLDNYNYSHVMSKKKNVESSVKIKKLDVNKIDIGQLQTSFVANIGIRPEEQGTNQNRTVVDGQSFTDKSYLVGDLSVRDIMISDQDRPKTKFIKDQKSHTVPWTLVRNTITSFQGQPVIRLLKYLHDRFEELANDVSHTNGKELVVAGLKKINDCTGSHFVDEWQAEISEIVRSYFIAHQVAESTSYINPKEADRALGHGESSHMKVLRRNEYTLSSRGGIIDDEERIGTAVKSMFDAEITNSFGEKNVRNAYKGLLHMMNASFPVIMKHYGQAIQEKMMEETVGSGRKLGELMADKSLEDKNSLFGPVNLGMDENPFGDDSLINEHGFIRAQHMPDFIQAYRSDLALSNAFLTEGEGQIAATYLGLTLEVYSASPKGNITNIQNPGGGDCLIHALVQAFNIKAGKAPGEASAEEILAIRKHIAAELSDETIENLCIAAVTGKIVGIDEPGLGPKMRNLLRNPAIMYAKTVRLFDNDNYKEAPDDFPNIGNLEDDNVQDAPVTGPVSTFGGGEADRKLALLCEGNHYILMRNNDA